jgi:hypothetical protein
MPSLLRSIVYFSQNFFAYITFGGEHVMVAMFKTSLICNGSGKILSIIFGDFEHFFEHQPDSNVLYLKKYRRIYVST